MRPRLQSALDLVLGRAPASGRVRRARQQASEDDGFTIVETLVTLLVVSVVVGLVLGFVTNLVQQSTNVRDTMAGVQQDQTAGEGLLQYLHSSIVVLPGSNATTLETSILAGVSSGGTPQTATFGAALTPPAGPKLDANFSTSLTPNGGTTRTLNDYDAVSSPTAFTYYYNNYSVTPVVLASTTTPTNAQLSEIVAVGVDVTFLAGPQVPTVGLPGGASHYFSDDRLPPERRWCPSPDHLNIGHAPERHDRSGLPAHRDSDGQPDPRRRDRHLHRDSGRRRVVRLHLACRREHVRQRHVHVYPGDVRDLRGDRVVLRHR